MILSRLVYPAPVRLLHFEATFSSTTALCNVDSAHCRPSRNFVVQEPSLVYVSVTCPYNRFGRENSNCARELGGMIHIKSNRCARPPIPGCNTHTCNCRQADAGSHGTLLRAGVAPCLLPFQHATVVEQVVPEVHLAEWLEPGPILSVCV